MPTLYIVATPIGNLEDITLRALRILREADIIAAEDTRITRKLLSRYDIHTPLISFNEHNESQRLPILLDALASGDVALVSDAGTPGVNDPGQSLVRAAASASHAVVPVPGASAVTAAVAVSGLVGNGFVHAGFLPRKRGERIRLFQALAHHPQPIAALESPHRLRKSLQDALDVLGNRQMVVCRELTKLHEQVFHGSVSDALAHFPEPRGEFTLVFAGAALSETEQDAASEDDVRQMLETMRRQGFRARDAVGEVAAALSLPRREVYRLWLDIGASERPAKPSAVE